MKKAAILFLALLIVFAIVGCNVAPNIPGVTPYPPARVSPYPTTPGNDTRDTYRFGYNGFDYNTENRNPANNNRDLGKATDNDLAPGAR